MSKEDSRMVLEMIASTLFALLILAIGYLWGARDTTEVWRSVRDRYYSRNPLPSE